MRRLVALTAALIALAWPLGVGAQTPTPIPTLSPWREDLTQNALVIGWTPYVDHVYELRWRAVGATDWSTTESAGYSGHKIEPLSPGTDYEVQVRTRRIDLTTWGDWSASLTARTLEVPTPTPAAYRLEAFPDILDTRDVSAFVYPSGDMLIMARYFISRPDQPVFPPPGEVLSWLIAPPHIGSHASIQPSIQVAPVEISHTPLGYGEGLVLARCVCYAGFDFSAAKMDVERGLVWDIVQQVNPSRLPAPAALRALTFTPVFLTDGDPAAAEAAVSRILGAVDARQGTRLLADGYVTPTGASYLEAYVSGVRFLLPGIHYGIGQSIELDAGGRAASTSTAPIGGVIISGGFEDLEGLLGIPASMGSALVIGALATVAVVLAGKITPLPGAGVVAGGLVLLIGAAMGWLPMWIVIAMTIMAGLVIVWMMFLKKGG